VPNFLATLIANPHGPLRLVRDNNTIIADRIEAALEGAVRRRGLLGRDSLDPSVAFIIAPCPAVHTFFMRFAIDLVFVARDGRVLKVRSNVGPWRIAFSFGAFATIEMAAGSIDRTGMAPGWKLVVR
jgi:uncharacterized membrane protein (UPF0127 family)